MSTGVLTRPQARRGVLRTADRGALGIAAYAFSSRLGWMALVADRETVFGLTFGHDLVPSAIRSLNRIFGRGFSDPGQLSDAPTAIRLLAERLQAFAEGEKVDFCDARLNLEHLTPFGEGVTQRCREIAWGETLSYRDLAVACGRPGAARAVGNVMRNNRFPLIVPCHRVLASSGGLGGYSAPQGLKMKQRLLELERRV